MTKGQYEHKEGKEASRFTHGLIKTRLYRIWSNMKTRCFNPNATRFEGWGGKGITICPEWKDDDGSLWFKRTKKLLKFCADNGIEL